MAGGSAHSIGDILRPEAVREHSDAQVDGAEACQLARRRLVRRERLGDVVRQRLVANHALELRRVLRAALGLEASQHTALGVIARAALQQQPLGEVLAVERFKHIFGQQQTKERHETRQLRLELGRRLLRAAAKQRVAVARSQLRDARRAHVERTLERVARRGAQRRVVGERLAQHIVESIAQSQEVDNQRRLASRVDHERLRGALDVRRPRALQLALQRDAAPRQQTIEARQVTIRRIVDAAGDTARHKCVETRRPAQHGALDGGGERAARALVNVLVDAARLVAERALGVAQVGGERQRLRALRGIVAVERVGGAQQHRFKVFVVQIQSGEHAQQAARERTVNVGARADRDRRRRAARRAWRQAARHCCATAQARENH
jgi:hypothetical protein